MTQTFGDAITGFNKINDYEFGTNSGRNVNNLTDLAAAFDPYGIAGTTVIQQEWERYQTFNSSNFVFGPHTLDLTATLLGGLHAGGINSGQIASKQTFRPGVTGYNTYAFEVRMKVPNARGAWTGTWFYCKQPDKDDHSEIDNPEFLNMKNQNQFDWTGFNHGPNVGTDFHSIMSNPWSWRPGMDFSADYHNYQTVWTPTAVYKYVDGLLIRATNFKYTSPGPAQVLVGLAVGSDNTGDLRGLQPNYERISRSSYRSITSQFGRSSSYSAVRFRMLLRNPKRSPTRTCSLSEFRAWYRSKPRPLI